MIPTPAALVESWRPTRPPGPRLRQLWNTWRTGAVRVEGADVVRISGAISAEVLQGLRARGVTRGPILANGPRRCIELVVPRGTAAAWPDLPGTRCVKDAVIRCPAPQVTAISGLAVDGRAWIRPPDAAPMTSDDAAALAEAVATALVRRAAPWLDAQNPHHPTGEADQWRPQNQ